MLRDGTKIREYEGEPDPEFPESMDVKITNRCSEGCPFCHENSVYNGQHGDLNLALGIISDLPRGVEIAVGGGDPFSHPGFSNFMRTLGGVGIIPNATLNGKKAGEHLGKVSSLRKQGGLFGLGVSYVDGVDLTPIMDDNTVVHLIAGIHDPSTIDVLMKKHGKLKVLVLGYKKHGRGVDVYQDNKNKVDKNIREWYTKVATYFKRKGLIMSFDNLAIEQLNLRRFFTDESWDRFFMGKDGSATFYMDMVKKEFAISSTSKVRHPIRGSIFEMFKIIREESR
jgi:hypothetical protein